MVCIPVLKRILTKQDLQEALASKREGLDLLEPKDPNVNISATEARKVMAELNCYKIVRSEEKDHHTSHTRSILPKEDHRRGKGGRGRCEWGRRHK